MILLKLCNSMIDINELFFELIRVSLGVSGCLSNTPTNEEWIALYDIAKKQSLVGICFAGVQRLQLQRQCLEEMQYLTWMGMAAKIQQRNEVVNRQCVDVQQMIEKEGFHTFIMKVCNIENQSAELLILRITAHANSYKRDNYMISSDFFGAVRELVVEKDGFVEYEIIIYSR